MRFSAAGGAPANAGDDTIAVVTGQAAASRREVDITLVALYSTHLARGDRIEA
jgi:hypothetical protein